MLRVPTRTQCPERRGMAELDAERGVEEDGVLNAAPSRAPPPGEGGDHAVLSGKTSGGAGEKGRCRCPGCIIARNKVDDFTRQMGRCRSVPTCVEKSWGGTGDEGSRGRPVGGRGPGTMLVA